MRFQHPSVAATVLALLGTALAAPGPAAAELPPIDPRLERPEALEPAVRFWQRIYAEVASDGGLIHDAEHLGVVYERIRLPEGLSRRARERRVEDAKDAIRASLRALAEGKREGLTAHEAEVLSRWPDGVSDATLARAAHQVRFQLGQADRFRAGLVRSGAWIDMIRDTMRRYGVPLELAALPHVESSFDPGAYSRVGASGMWQFTRSTGRLFMQIDSVVDERLDPWIATDAAARLLTRNHEITESWPLAITAYNHGAAGMQRAARRLGTRDIAKIVRDYQSRTFGFASRNFYASFLAAVEVDRRADEIFGVLERHTPIDYTLIQMPHYYRVPVLAQALGVDAATLREHNHALRPAVWQGNKFVPRGYAMRIPSAALSADPPQLLARIPPDERLARQHRDRYHKVRRGETLSVIARRYGLSVGDLVALNNLRSRHRIRVGQILTLPGGAEPTVAIAREDPPESGWYTVRRGDNLSIIGERFGVSASALASENGLHDRNRIHAGQRLRIPGAGPVALASARVTEPEPPAQEPPQPPPEPAVATDPAPVTEPPVATEPTPATEPPVATDPAPVTEPPVVAEPDPIPKPRPTSPPVPDPAARAPLRVAAVPDAEPDVEMQADGEIGPEIESEQEADAAEATQATSERAPDPSDYAVHDRHVTVQAAETLGHYAEWLEVRASRLRAINGMRFDQPLVIGRRVKLDFGRVTPDEFENRRLEYHSTLQGEFFDAFEVTGTERHVLRRGESLWYLAERKFRVPIWLLRQYNPELDFGALQAGASMVVPVVEPRAG